VSTEGIDDVGSAGAPRERWPFRWWWIPAYFAANLFLDTVGTAVWDWVIATGGYGLSNAIAGLIAATVCFAIYARTRVGIGSSRTRATPNGCRRQRTT
jgi:hypothetical protein